jgi:hypothetical protein
MKNIVYNTIQSSHFYDDKSKDVFGVPEIFTGCIEKNVPVSLKHILIIEIQ